MFKNLLLMALHEVDIYVVQISLDQNNNDLAKSKANAHSGLHIVGGAG